VLAILHSALNWIISNLLRGYLNAKWKKFLGSLHPQKAQLWKIARYFKTTHVSIPPLIDNGAQIPPAEDKAEVLATRFERVHDLTITKTPTSHALEVDSTLDAFLRRHRQGGARCPPLRVKEVQRDITSLKRRSAQGEDGVTTVMIRHLPTAAIKHLTHLFSSALSLGHFPQPWKQAKVLPILKPQKPPSHPASYRPISLLSSISKMLERVVARRLAAHAKRLTLYLLNNLASERSIQQLHNWHASPITSLMGITSENIRAWYYWT
jgi:hypothetical protein